MDELIATDEINTLLMAINEAILIYGIEDGYEMNDTGLKIQKIYDKVYDENK